MRAFVRSPRTCHLSQEEVHSAVRILLIGLNYLNQSIWAYEGPDRSTQERSSGWSSAGSEMAQRGVDPPLLCVLYVFLSLRLSRASTPTFSTSRKNIQAQARALPASRVKSFRRLSPLSNTAARKSGGKCASLGLRARCLRARSWPRSLLWLHSASDSAWKNSSRSTPSGRLLIELGCGIGVLEPHARTRPGVQLLAKSARLRFCAPGFAARQHGFAGAQPKPRSMCNEFLDSTVRVAKHKSALHETQRSLFQRCFQI